MQIRLCLPFSRCSEVHQGTLPGQPNCDQKGIENLPRKIGPGPICNCFFFLFSNHGNMKSKERSEADILQIWKRNGFFYRFIFCQMIFFCSGSVMPYKNMGAWCYCDSNSSSKKDKRKEKKISPVYRFPREAKLRETATNKPS